MARISPAKAEEYVRLCIGMADVICSRENERQFLEMAEHFRQFTTTKKP